MTSRDTFLIALNKLNKLVTNNSQDIPEYLWCYNFNEAQGKWIEENFKYDEFNKTQIHKLQKILVTNKIVSDKVNKHWYTEFNLPDNFLKYSSSYTKIDQCPNILENHLFEEHNVKKILKDPMWEPSLKFEETIITIAGQKIVVYQKDFLPQQLILSYYRNPAQIDIADGFKHTDGTVTVDINPEWDDINTNEIIDLAVMQIINNIK